MADKREVKPVFEFLVPEENVLSAARALLDSADQERRDVAKAMLDAAEVTIRTRAALSEGEKTEGTFDLAPYFDHWIGDALDSAQRLVSSEDNSVRLVAECLIGQFKAMIQSKEAFLREAKRALS